MKLTHYASFSKKRKLTQHNDTQHNGLISDIQHYDTQNNDTQNDNRMSQNVIVLVVTIYLLLY